MKSKATERHDTTAGVRDGPFTLSPQYGTVRGVSSGCYTIPSVTITVPPLLRG